MEELDLKNVSVGDAVVWDDGVNYRCYYIQGISQDRKTIKIHPYEVYADQEKAGGMGHQNWVFFKTRKEGQKYLAKFGKGDTQEPIEAKDEIWKIRYNHWYRLVHNELTKREEWVRVLDDCLRWCGGIQFSKEPYYYYDWEF